MRLVRGYALRRALAGSAGALCAAALVAPAHASSAPEPLRPAFVAGEVLVRYADTAPVATRRAARDAVGATGERAVGRAALRTRLLHLRPGMSVSTALSRLRSRPGVLWAEPNTIIYPASLPNDPLFPDQWGLRNAAPGEIDANAVPAWELLGFANEEPPGEEPPGDPEDPEDPDPEVCGPDDPGPEDPDPEDPGDPEPDDCEPAEEPAPDPAGVVAVIDTGIDSGHLDLIPNLRPDLSRNFVPASDGIVNPDAWADVDGHGTHVAGILGARGGNAVGTSGVDWNAGLAAVRVCDPPEEGSGGCPVSSVSAGIDYAGAMGVRVVNMSLSGSTSNSITEALEAHPETLYVVAAGNDNRNLDTLPGTICATPLENVLCVGAVTRKGERATFSNYSFSVVDIAAPGVLVLSSVLDRAAHSLSTNMNALDGWIAEPEASWTVGPDPEPPLAKWVQPAEGHAESTLTLGQSIDLDGLRSCRVGYEVAVTSPVDGWRMYLEVAVGDGEWQTVRSFPRVASPTEIDAGFRFGRTDALPFLDDANDARLRFRVVAPMAEPTGVPPFRASRVNVRCLVAQPAEGSYGFKSGTSMATPFVAGAASLLLKHDPDLGTAELRQALTAGAKRLPDLACSVENGGLLDIAGALEYTPSTPQADVECLPEPTPGQTTDPPPQPPAPAPPAPPVAAPVAPADPPASAVPPPGPITEHTPPPAPRATVLPGRPAVIGTPGRVTRTGRVALRVRCAAGAAPCAGTVALWARAQGTRGAQVAIARRVVRLGPRRTATVTVQLTARGRQLLARNPRLRVQVRVVPTRGPVAVRSVVLRAAPPPLRPARTVAPSPR